MRRLLGLVIGVCCAAAIGCGASRSKAGRAPAAPAVQDARTGAPQTAHTGDPHAADLHAEIDALDRQIADELARAQIAPPAIAMCTGPACATAMSQPFAPPAIGGPACHPTNTDKCTDACTLATSICRNQQKICELAQQLDGDDWAANQCGRAKASCQAAHDGCCSCVR
jgi:hypothetical protein